MRFSVTVLLVLVMVPRHTYFILNVKVLVLNIFLIKVFFECFRVRLVYLHKTRASTMSTKYSLSRDAAISFVQGKLDIQNATTLFESNKRSLLDTIIDKWMQTIPFQSIKQLATDIPKRAVPSEEEAVTDVLSGIGGLCYTHGIAIHHVLSALGYDTYPAISAVGDDVKDHVAVFVKNVESQGDLFLVDTGVGFPTFRAIQVKTSSGFIEETERVTESFCTYKYVKRGDTYLRYNLASKEKTEGGFKYVTIGNELWCEFYTVWIEPVGVDMIQDFLHKNIYAKLDNQFNRTICVNKYPGNNYIGFKQNTLLYDEGGKLQSTIKEDPGELRRSIEERFPELPLDMLEKAFRFWLSLDK